MAGYRLRRPLKLTRHKSGTARIRIKSKDTWSGRWGTPKSEEKYRQAIAWYVEKGEPPRPPASDDATSAYEIALRHWTKHVRAYIPEPAMQKGVHGLPPRLGLNPNPPAAITWSEPKLVVPAAVDR